MAYSLNPKNQDPRVLEHINLAIASPLDEYPLAPVPTLVEAQRMRYQVYSALNFLRKGKDENGQDLFLPPEGETLTTIIKRLHSGEYQTFITRKYRPGASNDAWGRTSQMHGLPGWKATAHMPHDGIVNTPDTPVTMDDLLRPTGTDDEGELSPQEMDNLNREHAVMVGIPWTSKYPDWPGALPPYTPPVVSTHPLLKENPVSVEEWEKMAGTPKTYKPPTQQKVKPEAPLDKMARPDDWVPEDTTIRNAFAPRGSSDKSENGGND